jgi:murein DD-endopeptidase MepM/ murein hydrolase activator NlpD
MRVLFFFVLFATSLFAFRFEIINQELANGKSALLKFPKEESIVYKDISVGKKHFKIFQNPLNANEYYALVPFSYYDKPASKEIKVHYLQKKQAKEQIVFIKLLSGKYKKETIHVDSSKVNPKAPAVKKRIAKEYKEAMRIYHTVTDRSYLREPFILPLQSKITSEFGKARVYNGLLKGYHSGTDFRAKVGTPIVAANDGRVALVKDRFYSGGTVVIDHGEGIYTCYFHMSKFDVKEGEMVKRGQKLGLSGKSGRVTGPHLHFAARVDGIQVDPLQLITLLNNNLLKEDKQ